jgi:hypothetical protein
MATVTASYNWVSGETVTPAKLNTTAAPTVVVADNEVTTAKILDANVTTAKILDANVTTAKIADASSTTTGVTNAKLRHSAALSVIGRSADSSGAPADIAAANDGEVFRRSGTAVGFGTVATAGIANAAVTPAKLSQPLTLDTAKATTSGTNIDFTGIPSWAKRVTVTLNGVSTSGTSALLIQLGTSSGVTTSGYTGGGMSFAVSSLSGITTTAGIPLTGSMLAGNTYGGTAVIANTSSNSWAGSGSLGGSPTISAGNGGGFGSGSIALASTLDRIRLTTVNGTDTFDAGSVNIMYEG